MKSFNLSNLTDREKFLDLTYLPEYVQIAMEHSWATCKVPGEEWAIQLVYTGREI